MVAFCVAILFTSGLMAAGLGSLLSRRKDLKVELLPMDRPDLLGLLRRLKPNVVIVEAPKGAPLKEGLLRVLPKGLVVHMSLDANTMSLYYIKRGVPATTQELIKAIEEAYPEVGEETGLEPEEKGIADPERALAQRGPKGL